MNVTNILEKQQTLLLEYITCINDNIKEKKAEKAKPTREFNSAFKDRLGIFHDIRIS